MQLRQLLGRNDARSERAEPVKACTVSAHHLAPETWRQTACTLAVTPLRPASALPFSRRHVVGDRVTQYTSHRLVGRGILGRPAKHNRQLHFVVNLRVMADCRDRERADRISNCIGRLEEGSRIVRYRQVQFRLAIMSIRGACVFGSRVSSQPTA